MKKTLVALTTVTAIAFIGTVVQAQDPYYDLPPHPERIVLVTNNDIDGPVAHALSVLLSVKHNDAEGVIPYCVIAFGKNADALALEWKQRYPDATVWGWTAKDRYASAEFVAGALRGGLCLR